MPPKRESVLAWLNRLAENRLLVLNPRMVLEAEELLGFLAAKGADDPTEYGCALASLLAQNEEQWTKIIEHFHGYFAEPIAAYIKQKQREQEENPQSESSGFVPSPWKGYREPYMPPSLPRWKRWRDRLPSPFWSGILGVLIGAIGAALMGLLIWTAKPRGKAPPEIPGALITEAAKQPVVPVLEVQDAGSIDASRMGTVSPTVPAKETAPTAQPSATPPLLPLASASASALEVNPNSPIPQNNKILVDQKSNADDTSELVEPAKQHSIQRPPHLPAPPIRGSGWLYGILIAYSMLLAGLAARFSFAHRSFQADVKESWRRAEEERRELMKEVGEKGVLYHLEDLAPLPLAAIDDVATLLGRLTRREAGHELDVNATIGKGIDAGGHIEPVYAPGRRKEALLVLVDMEDGQHPYLDSVNYILKRWHRQGVPMIRYNFSERPLDLKRHEDGQAITLEGLGRQHEDAPLLIFSRMLRPQDKSGRFDWLKRYFAGGHQAFPNRAWVDLDPRLPSERSRDGRRSLKQLERYWTRYPCTREGLIACATALLSRGQKKKTPREEALLDGRDPRVEEALHLWAAAAACVPDPEWSHLDSLRRALPEIEKPLPDRRYVQRLLDWVREKRYFEGDLGTGTCLRLKREARRELLVWLARWDREHFAKREDGVEYRTRRLLIQQLEAAAVGNDAFDQKKRNMKKAVHEAILNPGRVEQLLREYGESGVAEELKELLEDQIERQEALGLSSVEGGQWTLRTKEVVEGWARGREGVRARDLLNVGRWNERQGVVGAVGLVLLSWSWGVWWKYWVRSEAKHEVNVAAVRRARISSIEKARPSPEPAALERVAPMNFMRIWGGAFKMGSPRTEINRDDDEVQHLAAVNDFEMALHEVTQKQWITVMGTKPFDCDYGCGDDYPAQRVSWEDAVQFMNKLTEIENKTRSSNKQWTPCYEKQGEKWIWKKTCTGYRLPTEAEWEYAARAGTKTAYSFRDDEKELCKHGNGANKDCDDGYRYLAPVGKFKANPWGLYDMHGNAWEWVWDWYAAYPENTKVGYAGPEEGASGFRVLRSGAFVDAPGGLRSSDRFSIGPSIMLKGVGFRCVRGSPQE